MEQVIKGFHFSCVQEEGVQRHREHLHCPRVRRGQRDDERGQQGEN